MQSGCCSPFRNQRNVLRVLSSLLRSNSIIISLPSDTLTDPFMLQTPLIVPSKQGMMREYDGERRGKGNHS